jgi:hypothetical protein
MLFLSLSAWASRDDTVANLFYAATDQAEVAYYGGVGDYYTAYSYQLNAYSDLYNAWLYAPVGSYMEAWSASAYQYAYDAQTYWYYSYLGYGYQWNAVYSSYLAQLYTAYAQYAAAFNF